MVSRGHSGLLPGDGQVCTAGQASGRPTRRCSSLGEARVDNTGKPVVGGGHCAEHYFFDSHHNHRQEIPIARASIAYVGRFAMAGELLRFAFDWQNERVYSTDLGRG